MSEKTQALYDAIQDMFDNIPNKTKNKAKDTEKNIQYSSNVSGNVLCQYTLYERDEFCFRVYKLLCDSKHNNGFEFMDKFLIKDYFVIKPLLGSFSKIFSGYTSANIIIKSLIINKDACKTESLSSPNETEIIHKIDTTEEEVVDRLLAVFKA